MKKTHVLVHLLGIALSLSTGSILAQTTLNATTEDGQQVILSTDGTWRYATAGVPLGKDSPGAAYITPSAATKVLTVNKGAASLNYDPAIWVMATDQADPNRTNFSHKSGDIYGIVIAERLGLSPDALIEIVLENARKAATALTVREQSKRLVNGTEITYMRFEPTIQGIDFVFEGYYYAGPAGSIQVIAYTGKNLYAEYKQEIENFLNGFAVTAR